MFRFFFFFFCFYASIDVSMWIVVSTFHHLWFSFETPCGTHALHEQRTVVSQLVLVSLSILSNNIDENQTWDRWLYEPNCRQPVIRMVSSDLRHSRQATFCLADNTMLIVRTQPWRWFCQRCLRKNDAELMCDVRTRTPARSFVHGGQRRRMAGQGDQGVNSDSNSTDSFQRDVLPIPS